MELSRKQSSNALLPIAVSPSGNETDSNAAHFENRWLSTALSIAGNETLTSDVHSANAYWSTHRGDESQPIEHTH
eukprot:m.474748 g.474748  ORF g.474748 m.474748 type:complete len:75 (+) comp36863_c0_seq1:695-919(+)